MSSSRKSVIAIGVKSGTAEDPSYTAERIRTLVEAETAKLRDRGIDLTSYFVDPDAETASTVREIKQKLQGETGPFDGVSVGFGLRGTPELTPLFESIINVIFEAARPVPRMMFAVGPSDISAAALRAFPELA